MKYYKNYWTKNHIIKNGMIYIIWNNNNELPGSKIKSFYKKDDKLYGLKMANIKE